MDQFSSLAKLSVIIKRLAFLIAVFSLAGGLFDGGPDGWVIVLGGQLTALSYWMIARVIDVILQINKNTIDTVSGVGKLQLVNGAVDPGQRQPLAAVPDSLERIERALARVETASRDLRVVTELGATGREPLDWQPLANSASHLARGDFRLVVGVKEAMAGRRVDLTLDALPAREPVRLTLVDGEGRGLRLATVIATDAGTLSYAARIPEDVAAGEYAIHAATFSQAAAVPVTVISI